MTLCPSREQGGACKLAWRHCSRTSEAYRFARQVKAHNSPRRASYYQCDAQTESAHLSP